MDLQEKGFSFAKMHYLVEELKLFIQLQNGDTSAESKEKAFDGAIAALDGSKWLRYHSELKLPSRKIIESYHRLLWQNWIDTLTVLTINGAVLKGFVAEYNDDFFVLTLEDGVGRATVRHDIVLGMYYTLALHRGSWWKDPVLEAKYKEDVLVASKHALNPLLYRDPASLAKKYYLHCRAHQILGTSVHFNDLGVHVSVVEVDLNNPEVADFILQIRSDSTLEEWAFNLLPAVEPVCVAGGDKKYLRKILTQITSTF